MTDDKADSSNDEPTAWSCLTHEAQSVLEWMENPHSETLHVMTLRVGESPSFDGRSVTRTDGAVDEVLFEEIRGWIEANADDFETLEISDDAIVAKLRPDAGLKPQPAAPRP